MKYLVLALLLLSLGFSATVVVNSEDGRDLVSATYYAANTGDKILFVPPVYNEPVIYGKIGWNGQIILVQSASNPILTGMADALRNKGNTVEMIISSEPYQTNRLLAERSGARKFILVDPVYGYNTVSAVAYAKQNSMYLLFVNTEQKDAVITFLKGKNPQDILLYGYIDGDVKDALSANGLSYREINTGDKFDDNMQMLDLYLQQNPSKKQVILSDGNAFEDTITAGDDPVVLISPVISTSVFNYLKDKVSSGQIAVGMVVDAEYAQTAYDLKESINQQLGSEKLHVLVKFGQSVPAAGSGLFPVDLFPVRAPIIGLNIAGAEYNTLSRELEITYENTGNAPEYVKSRIIVYVDGNPIATVGDEEPFSIAKGQALGRGYPVEIENGAIIANVTAMYGSSRKSTENGIVAILNAGRVEFTDRSALEISGFTEDGEDLFVTFANNGSSAVFFRADANANISGRMTKIEDDRVYSLAQGEAKMVKFPGVLKGSSGIVAGADYGAREAFLDKRVEKSYVPAPAAADYTLLLAGLLLLLVLIIGYLVWGRSKSAVKGRR
ncbi:MAG: hypothetical protein NTY83_02315 [Candidatus Micrarchaeota archaeon]|nr:hypothetical protein [Candidatus Micrarchaeota archaeon]